MERPHLSRAIGAVSVRAAAGDWGIVMALRHSLPAAAVKMAAVRTLRAGAVTRLSRAWAPAAGVLLAGVLTAAVLPPGDGSAVTVAVRGAMTPGRLPDRFGGLIVPVKALSFTWLSGVYCSSASNCWAVGVSQASVNAAMLNQVLRWNGSRWRLSPAPQPGGRKHGDVSTLESVRCLTARDCWAVGYYLRRGASLDEALHWNGRTWSQVPAPTPGGILSNDVNELNDVFCASHANCWAVGDFGTQDTSANQALHWNGKSWSLVSTPDPAGTNAEDDNVLGSVRCSSSSACLAVGFDTTPGSTGATLNESLRWNGRKWRALTTLDPVSATTDAVNELTGLACSSAASCWAAGSFGTSSAQTSLNQILYWNGRRWFEDQLPDPGGTSTGNNNVLTADTCVAARDCWAVGTYSPPGDPVTDLRNELLRWNGTKWSQVRAPDPGRTSQGANALIGVRCTSAANCWAVGFQERCDSLVDQILHWNGRKWLSADGMIEPGAAGSVPATPACPL
jgi:hypothetical protein